ncbi:hypothetical protein [Halorubellus sp. PRR65]|uniref:hypothetical protein n=1 Tax=Halorubellus sp. PRR65 TaxID=3098148 RepID=UPI002B25A2D4|nr:hypothetical protein [Halorubellus sp. PRR65]
MSRRRGRRVRGDDGRYYDRRACKDAGKKAHENRLQTTLRRLWWTLRGLASKVAVWRRW